MKKLSIIFISFLFYACIQLPGAGSNNNQRIKAKVIRITCASTVIQILDESYFNLGETWKMEGTTNTYEHIAAVSNKCEFPYSLSEGDEFYFKIINESDARNDCAVCMMYDFPPSKGIYLKVLN